MSLINNYHLCFLYINQNICSFVRALQMLLELRLHPRELKQNKYFFIQSKIAILGGFHNESLISQRLQALFIIPACVSLFWEKTSLNY